MMREGRNSDSRCQDCGNRAKKDCQYSRCRSCCKSRNFECQTHVKSTWIPVASRRARHQIPPPLFPNPKSYRQIQPLGFVGENFPAEMFFPAVFRCVQVSSTDSMVDESAYQTSVRIGGHVFAGVLYDQGPDPAGAGNYVAGDSSSSAAAGILQHPSLAARRTAPAETGTTTSSFATPFIPFTNATSHIFSPP